MTPEAKPVHWAIGDEGDLTACGKFGEAVAVTSPFDTKALKITCLECAQIWVTEVNRG